MHFTLIILLAISLPTLVYSLTCHRCFGNSFCHDPADAEFPAGVKTATCETGRSSYWASSEDDDSFTTEVKKVLNEQIRKQFGGAATQDYVMAQYCLTATVKEPHDNYTLRTCLDMQIPTEGTFPSACELAEIIVADQNLYNGTFLCKQCNDGDFCNIHALLAEGDGDGNGTDDGDGDGDGDGSLGVKLPESAIAVAILTGTLSLLALLY